jgi:hypothetical protein
MTESTDLGVDLSISSKYLPKLEGSRLTRSKHTDQLQDLKKTQVYRISDKTTLALVLASEDMLTRQNMTDVCNLCLDMVS